MRPVVEYVYSLHLASLCKSRSEDEARSRSWRISRRLRDCQWQRYDLITNKRVSTATSVDPLKDQSSPGCNASWNQTPVYSRRTSAASSSLHCYQRLSSWPLQASYECRYCVPVCRTQNIFDGSNETKRGRCDRATSVMERSRFVLR